MTVGTLGYLLALLGYALLSALMVFSWKGRATGLFAVGAALASVLWAGLTILGGVAAAVPDTVSDARALFPPAVLLVLAETLRSGAWCAFLIRVLIVEHDRRHAGRWVLTAIALFSFALTSQLLAPLQADDQPVSLRELSLLGPLLIAVFGLSLIEQLYRNCRPSQRWAIKHLCLGLGAAFVYDLFFYADALLLRQIDWHLWEARGFVNAMIVPLIAVSAARNPSWALEIHVSREVVFYSATLTGSGVYLMAMAAVGYYIRFVGGTWGGVLQVAFLFMAGVFLALLLFSSHVRARLRLLLSEHFFSFKYDYREEWQRFTQRLAHGGPDVPRAVLAALGAIVDSPGGWLWTKRDGGGFELAARLETRPPASEFLPAEHPFGHFLLRSGVVNLDEYHLRPDIYPEFELPAWLAALPNAWLAIPLPFRDELCGFALLLRPQYRREINWEDRSLLKTAGLQAASYIAQHLADRALMRARQFEAFHQLAAYVAHDLKNLLAQQSLLLANAEKHKHNPAFVEDMLTTIRSSVARMQRLMAQLRAGVRGSDPAPVALDELLRAAVAQRSTARPVPRLGELPSGLVVWADAERLRTVLGHLIQNAQEATRAEGRVELRLRREERWAVIEIEDDGVGMSEEFIRERLFRPFDSTKGLTGMGIGAFESRELARALGGELTVRSQPGSGTCFRLMLPLLDSLPAGSTSPPLAEGVSQR